MGEDLEEALHTEPLDHRRIDRGQRIGRRALHVEVGCHRLHVVEDVHAPTVCQRYEVVGVAVNGLDDACEHDRHLSGVRVREAKG